jgi:hypothetical protein
MDTPTEWTTHRILDLFSPEMRQQAAEAFWDDPRLPEELRQQAVALLVETMKFRLAKFKKLPREKKTAYLLKYLRHSSLESLRRGVLISYHAVHRKELVDRFLACWELGGQPGEGASASRLPHPTLVKASLESLQNQYSPLDIAVYFATASLANGWGEVLWPFVEALLTEQAGASSSPARAPGREAQGLFAEVEEFNALDHHLIQQVLAAASQAPEALPCTQVAALVEALIQLNPERAVSYFHRGFLQGQLPQEGAEPEAEQEVARRTWTLAGLLLALAHQRAWTTLVAWADAHPDLLAEVLHPETPCAGVCAAYVFQGLWLVDRKEEAVALLSPALLQLAAVDFAPSLVRFAETQLQGQAARPARLLLEKLLQVRQWLRGLGFSPDFLARLTHRQAQCLRGEQGFVESKALLQGLLAADFPWLAEVHLDLGLVAGEFAWLSQVQVPADRESAAQVRERLHRGRPHFEQALADTKSPAAEYALGVLALLGGEYDEAAVRLERAHTRAAQDPGRYRPALLFERMRLYYALARLCALEESHLPQALELLQVTDQAYPAEEWPLWLLEEAAQIIDVAETPESLRLLEWLHQRAPKAIEIHLHDPELVHRSPALRQSLAQRAAQTRGKDAAARWQEHTALLATCLRGQDLEGASQVLDQLEALALEQPALRERFVALLSRPEQYQPAWDGEDALFSAALVFEAAGQPEQAYPYLRTLFFRYRGQGQVERAAGLLERIRAYHLPEALTEEVLRQAPALEGQAAHEPETLESQVREYLRQGHPLRLLVVGGNELQARFDEELQTYFQAELPGLELAFEHTPRVSSWDRYYDRIKGRLAHYDGLVLLRFQRTHLGRSLRALASQLGKPWFPCTGSGKSFLQRTLLNAAHTLASAGR